MWKFVLTFSLLCCGSEAIRVACTNENGGVVDWYILYKAPYKQNVLTGLEYIYIDSRGKRTMSAINDPHGVLANTLRPLFIPTRSMPPSLGFISYSDQPPGCNAALQFGHSKGVLLVNKDNGIWLLHSTPQFPFRRDQNHFWPESGKRNAQTFLCVTFPYEQFSLIGKHLQYIRAFPFEHDLPNDFHEELKKAVIWDKQPPPQQPQTLISSFNTEFYSIAKQLSEDETVGDLYQYISQAARSDVYVQTWGCQKDRAASSCLPGKYQVLNIKTIRTELGNWEPTHDHSKWCIAKDQNNHLICIADVNRAVTQYKRPGGALCFKNADVKNHFAQFAGDKENCPTSSNMDSFIRLLLSPDGNTAHSGGNIPPECDVNMDPSLMD